MIKILNTLILSKAAESVTLTTMKHYNISTNLCNKTFKKTSKSQNLNKKISIMCHKRKLLNKTNNKFNGFVNFIIALSLYDTFLNLFFFSCSFFIASRWHSYDTFTKTWIIMITSILISRIWWSCDILHYTLDVNFMRISLYCDENNAKSMLR